MKGKIALEEAVETPGIQGALFARSACRDDYIAEANRRLREYKQRIEEMDAAGIEKTILSLTSPGIQAILDSAKAVDTAKRVNDEIADFFIRNNPDRFLGFAALPLQDPKAAAKELERTIKDLGFKGALINGYTNVGDEDHAHYLDHPRVLDFWEKAAELDVPVYLHPRVALPSQRRIYEGYDALLTATWGFGLETGTHAVRLILSGLFDRFPSLNVILGHMGEGLPYMLPRLEHRLRHKTAGTHGAHKLSPTHYLRNNFYLTTSGVFHTQTLLSALLEVGSDRILFSVDYPFESMSEFASWFDNCPISDNDRLKIGRTNAQRLFNI